MQRLLHSKNYKYYNFAYCLFLYICIILTVFLPTMKSSYQYTSLNNNLVSGNNIISIFSIMEYIIKIISNPIYRNFYILWVVLTILTIISLILISIIIIIRILKTNYITSIFSLILLLPILISIYIIIDGDRIVRADLFATFTKVSYQSNYLIAFYISILLLILNIASIIIEFKYRKIIPAYNFDIKQYLPKRTPKPPKPPKPHKPTKAERIAELERQVKELQNKD